MPDETTPPQPPARPRGARPPRAAPAPTEEEIGAAVLDRLFDLGDRVTRVQTDVGHYRDEVAGLRAEVHEVRTTGQAIQGHLEQQDRTAASSLQQAAGEAAAIKVTVQALDAKMAEGFSALDGRLNGGLPQLAFVEGLIAHEAARQSRRVRWAAWLDELAGMLRYLFGAVAVTLAGFAVTHPVGRLPDPDLLPSLGAVGAALLATVSWTTYRKVHHALPEIPEEIERDERRAH